MRTHTPRALALVLTALLSLGAQAQQSDPVEVDWPAALRRLERQVEATPNDGPTWRALGDALVRARRHEDALRAYRRAQELGVKDEALTISIGDVLKDLKREGEAYREFAKVLPSQDPERRLTACQQVNYLAPYRYRQLRRPYFADLWMQAGHQSVGSTTYLDAVARAGVNLMPDERLQVYGVARVARDNRSGLVEGYPLEYFENSAVIGAGLRYQPLAEQPLYLYAEAGWAHDLIDLGRERNHSDLRAGATYYQEWFTNRSCESGAPLHPMRFVMTLSGESAFRSRYRDTIITTLDLRPGVRVYETPFSSVDVLAVAALYADSQAERKLQYTQFGAAVSWVPDARANLRIVVEALRTNFAQADSATNVNLYLNYAIDF